MSDDVFARNLLATRIVKTEQIEAARREQAVLEQSGTRLKLADVLLRQGVITPAIRENVEKITDAQKSGGIQQLGIYKLLKKLGEGGMGAVFLAEDTVANRKVALKVLSKKAAADAVFLERFKREAKAAGTLKHPNIVRAFTSRDTDVCEELGHFYYAMEYCEGKTVEDVIKKQGFIPWEEALALSMQVATGLQYAHERGFIHRDIKPGNIYLCSDGTAKILDMGLSKNIGGDAAQASNTLEGQVLGTPHYISPEQAQGQKTIDGRADIYSLGATLYHMLTGKTMYDGATSANIIFKHVTDPVPNPQKIREEIPDALFRLLQKMMAKQPNDRYRDCGALLSEMELVKAGNAPLTASELAAQAAIDAQRKQAEEDARFMQQFKVWAWKGGLAVGAIVILLILKSIVFSFFGPSKRDLERRAEIAQLRDDGEESLRKGNVQQAMEKFDKIVKMSETEETKDAVALEHVERAKKEKARLAAQLEEAARLKAEKEAAARQAEELKKKQALAQKEKEEEEKLYAERQKKIAEEKAAEAALKAEEEKKIAEITAAKQREEDAKRKKAEETVEAERKKKEAERVAVEERKEQLKRRAPLRTECLKPAETALFELSQIEKKLSDGANYAQFSEVLRDNILRVQAFLDAAEVKTLCEIHKDEEMVALRKFVQSASDNMFKCQSTWREKNAAGKEFDLQEWLGKIYSDIEDGKAAYEKIKKNQ
jgi:serine/threonine protein kinase